MMSRKDERTVRRKHPPNLAQGRNPVLDKVDELTNKIAERQPEVRRAVKRPPWNNRCMAQVSMLFGEVGAGKTTLARQLEESGAVRLSLDEWTIAAGGSRVDADWVVVEAMVAQIMRFWPQVIAAGTDAVLDLAFWNRADRDAVREAAGDVGADVDLIWVRCDHGERRRRCIARSADASDSYVIDSDGFDWITENRSIDQLGPDEDHRVLNTTVGPGGQIL